MTFGSRWAGVSHAALRIMMGFLFIPHGAQKMFGVLGRNADWSISLHALAGPIEFFGGILVMIGLWTRPAAYICSGTMAVAYWMAYGFKTFLPILNKGELVCIYCFVFLFIWAWANGSGLYSVEG